MKRFISLTAQFIICFLASFGLMTLFIGYSAGDTQELLKVLLAQF